MDASDRRLWQRIEPILDHALELEGAAREAWLSDACADDAELLRQVQALVRATEAQSPLDRPIAELAGSLAEEAVAGDPAAVRGRRIGPWQLERQIGAGGMGRVFLATRADGGFDQLVAIKVLRWEMATPALVERFRAERQILADLDHPGIARLVDGGVTEDGLPYLVMEFVEGVPLLEWCDREKASVQTRLQLFYAAARAVEHAHRNLIVHRDLKSSNILAVGPSVVKLLDFGVAKIVDEAAQRDLTQVQAAPATPRSAAPEQISGGAITTATDTWALGVLLYELLCGASPFGVPGTPVTDLSRQILNVDPSLPSDQVAGHRRRVLRGDLDNIVMKALSKEPDRRYGSAERMVEDVERYLAGRPVLARPSTFAYRARKFVARNRASVAATATVLLLGLALSGFYTWRLAAERDRARQEARKTEEVKAFVLSLFKVNDPAEAMGEEITARDLLDRGAERIAVELQDQPEIRSEMLLVLGHLYGELGLYDQSLALWEDAVDLCRAENPEDLPEALYRYGFTLGELGRNEEAERVLREALALERERQPGSKEVSTALNQLGMILAYAGEYDEAEALLRECVALREADGETAELAVALANLGLTVKWKGDFDEAERDYRRALSIREATIGRDAPEYANSLDNLGVLLGQRGNFEESETCFQQALEIRTRLLGEDHPDVALSVNNLATLYRVQGRLDEAEPMYRRVLELNTRIFGPDHRRVATNLTNLASVESARGHHEVAQELFARSLRIRREQLGAGHIDVAVNLEQLCAELLALGDTAQIDTLSAESVRIARGAVDEQSIQLAQVLHLRGRVLVRLDRLPEAVKVLDEALTIRTAGLAAGHRDTAMTESLLGTALYRSGELARAEPLLVASLEQLDPDRPGDADYVGMARASLRALYLDRGETARAASLGVSDG